MNRTKILVLAVALALATAKPALAVWLRSSASDVDKKFISGNPGLQPGLPSPDKSCWLAAAANMLAGAGYGIGNTVQARAEDIYIDMMNWQAATTAHNLHGCRFGGWVDNAVNWWLGSIHNTQSGLNPFTVVTVYGGVDCSAWANPNGARFIANELRDYQTLSLGVKRAGCGGGHAITAWGDDGQAALLNANPTQIVVADSDSDAWGDFQTYTFDHYNNPNPGGVNNGRGWYLSNDGHYYIIQVVTLSPTDSPIDPHDGPTQKVVGSVKIHQNRLEWATDLHYVAFTDYDILAYRTEINWPLSRLPVITESNAHHSWLTRDTLHVDWNLSNRPVPYGQDVTITTELVLHNRNGVWHEDMYFTYPGKEREKWLQPPDASFRGLGVRVDNKDDTVRILADDFFCTETGKITKIHLWGVWRDDFGRLPFPGSVEKFNLSIYSDDPVGDTVCDPNDDPHNAYSKPLDLLWSGSFDTFTVNSYSAVPREPFWDPYGGETGWDHRIWHYVIEIPQSNAFEQQGSAKQGKVYWLAVSADTEDWTNPFGWKSTSPDQGWQDAAVMYDPDRGQWSSISYPDNHDLAGIPVNFSFRIVGPNTVPGPFFPDFGWEIVTPELVDVNIFDITGGHVVGAFDIFDVSSPNEPQQMARYRFQHEYDYIQDPELHQFTIRGPNEQSMDYVAMNFRFGHSYGILDTHSLWQFEEWMTTLPDQAILGGEDSLELTLDWEGRLPYPKSNIIPADQIQELIQQGEVRQMIIEDFEIYTSDNPISQTWQDGLSNDESGSVAGHLNVPYVETSIAYGGKQALPFYYDNDGFAALNTAEPNEMISIPTISEMVRVFESSMDWTSVDGDDTDSLVVHFHGSSDNNVKDSDHLYVGIEDTRENRAFVSYWDSPTVLNDAFWHSWKINLMEFTEREVDIMNVNKMYLGIGQRDDPKEGGHGLVFIDEIYLEASK